MKAGDLESKRDWTDARDMVRAYWLAPEQAQHSGGVYNVGAGTRTASATCSDALDAFER